MRVRTLILCIGFLFCLAIQLPKLSSSQRPPALGKIFINSSNPSPQTIKINNVLRNEKTPVTLAVLPNTYSVEIGTCHPQQVTVASGETKEVDCPPAASNIFGMDSFRGLRFSPSISRVQ
jgi:hypothetical protein